MSIWYVLFKWNMDALLSAITLNDVVSSYAGPIT